MKLIDVVRTLFLVVLVAVSARVHADGQVFVLSMEGDGSATVIVDEEARTAFIHDGGRSGETKGAAGALIEGQPVLGYLKSKGITNVVISCSHPHEDHMGGLVTLIKSPTIKASGFSNLYFVDAIEHGTTTRNGNAILPLHQVYENTWGKSPPPKVFSASAFGKDGFAELTTMGLVTKDVKIHNFVYAPGAAGKDIHDQSVVVEYEVQAKGRTKTIVDFDDASTELIELWANSKPKRKADAVLMAHHGSRNNDMTAVLANPERFGVRDVIFAVNDENRFWHPTPESLKLALKSVGPDHIHLTGSLPGDAVEFGSGAELTRSVPGAVRARLNAFLEARISSANRRINKTDNADVRLRLIKDRNEVAAIQDDIKETMSASRMNRNGVAAWLGVVAPDVDRGEPPSSQGPPPQGPGFPPQNGNGSSVGGLPSRSESPAQHPRMTSPAPRPTYTRFQSYTSARGEIGFGGVLIGNKPRGVELYSLSFKPGKHRGTTMIQVGLRGRKLAWYGPVTNTQLWVAYNFVSPTDELRLKYSGLPIIADAGGLVGKVGDTRQGWTFAINPAAADTTLARDGMRLDMAVAASESGRKSPDKYRDLPWKYIGDFMTYQWLDEVADILVDGDHIKIQSATDHTDCLMRLRLLKERTPALPPGAYPEVVKAMSEAKQIRKALGLEPLTKEETKELSMRFRTELAERQAAENEFNSLKGREALNEDDLEELRSNTSAAVADFKSRFVPARTTNKLCLRLPFLKSINETAKLVALFHRYLDTSGAPLPAFPATQRPEFQDIEATLNWEDVWSEP